MNTRSSVIQAVRGLVQCVYGKRCTISRWFDRLGDQAFATSLTGNSLVMSDHGGLALSDFARSSGRRLLVFREDPADHWSPEGVLGVATCMSEVAMVDPDYNRPNIEVLR
jgi:hypothetical protein